MRFYPTADVNFYVDVPDGWDRYCRTPNKTWRPAKQLATATNINYWRDLEGAKKSVIKSSDLYFNRWMRTRIRPGACLPIFYAVGHRFISITKSFPAGFKCTPQPISLKEARERKEKDKPRKMPKKAKKKAKK